MLALVRNGMERQVAERISEFILPMFSQRDNINLSVADVAENSNFLQSKKFDKDAIFIKTVLKDLKDISPKIIHTENGVQEDIFLNYPRQIVGINYSRNRAIMEFKRANNDK